MIIDNIKNAKKYYNLSPLIKKAFEYLEKNNLKNINCGKYEIEGDDIFMNIQEYQTKQIQDTKAEAHKKYIDIQFMITGSETMGYANIDNNLGLISQDEDNDVYFYKSDLQFTTLSENDFVIFMPQDIHMPCLDVNNEKQKVKKVIVKIKDYS